jgi:hypothetical protein
VKSEAVMKSKPDKAKGKKDWAIFAKHFALPIARCSSEQR